MKICIIANGYPTNRMPQYGCFERDQAIALKLLGHEVSFLFVDIRILSSDKMWRGLTIDYREESGIKIFSAVMFPFSLTRFVSKRLYDFLHTRFLYRAYICMEKSLGKPDVLYAHYMYNIAYASYLKKKSGLPLVGMEHWSVLTQDKLSREQVRLGKLAYFNTDKLLAVSKSLQSHILRHFGKESIVVYDMLGQEFVSSSIVSHVKKLPFRFITVGSLKAIKGYQMLINAFSESGLASKGCTLSIVGDGEEHENLSNQISSLELNGKVVLLGRKTKEEIISLLSESHAFIVSSKSETFGVACIEALSQGLPVIATKCGGPEEIIDSSNGVLVEPDNMVAMSHAMNSIFENYEQYDSFEISRRCRLRFNPQNIAKTVVKYFEGGGNFFFIAIGNLIGRKGFDVLLSAFKQSRLAEKGCKIILIGDGPEKKNLEDQTKDLGISDYVKLMGRLTKLEIISLMQISHSFVLSSRAETFGVVCIEALSQGLPNIATVCGGPEEFIGENNGILIPPNDIDALSSAMVSVFENYKKYNMSRIASDCFSRFSPQVIAGQLTNIFNDSITINKINYGN